MEILHSQNRYYFSLVMGGFMASRATTNLFPQRLASVDDNNLSKLQWYRKAVRIVLDDTRKEFPAFNFIATAIHDNLALTVLVAVLIHKKLELRQPNRNDLTFFFLLACAKFNFCNGLHLVRILTYESGDRSLAKKERENPSQRIHACARILLNFLKPSDLCTDFKSYDS